MTGVRVGGRLRESHETPDVFIQQKCQAWYESPNPAAFRGETVQEVASNAVLHHGAAVQAYMDSCEYFKNRNYSLHLTYHVCNSTSVLVDIWGYTPLHWDEIRLREELSMSIRGHKNVRKKSPRDTHYARLIVAKPGSMLYESMKSTDLNTEFALWRWHNFEHGDETHNAHGGVWLDFWEKQAKP